MSVLEITADLRLTESQVRRLQGEVEQLRFDRELAVRENEKLQAENAALRTALAERNAKYWELHEAVERLFKTIEGEKREEGR